MEAVVAGLAVGIGSGLGMYVFYGTRLGRAQLGEKNRTALAAMVGAAAGLVTLVVRLVSGS